MITIDKEKFTSEGTGEVILAEITYGATIIIKKMVDIGVPKEAARKFFLAALDEGLKDV